MTVIISWNILRDNNALAQANALDTMISTYKPDILALQEVHGEALQIIARERPNQHHYLSVFVPYDDNADFSEAKTAKNGQTNGIALLLSENMTKYIIGRKIILVPENRPEFRQRFAIAIYLQNMTIINTHLCHHQIRNRRDLRLLARYALNDRPAIITADTNMVGPAFPPRHFSLSSKMTKTFRKIPFFCLDRIYTKNTQTLSSKLLKEKEYEISDHIPIMIITAHE